MKLFYDEKDRLCEIQGSGENGRLEAGESEFFTNYFDGLMAIEKEVKFKALEEQKLKEIECYKQNAEIAKANSEASIASSNAFVTFMTIIGTVALTSLALKNPEVFKDAQQQNPMPPNENQKPQETLNKDKPLSIEELKEIQSGKVKTVA